MTITIDALDLTVQAPRHPHGLGISLVVTSGGHYWRPVQTCSLHDPPPSVPTSGSYSSTYGLHKRAVHVLLECFLV